MVLAGEWLAVRWAFVLTYTAALLIGVKGVWTLLRRRRATMMDPPVEAKEPADMRNLRLAILVARATLARKRLYRLDHGGREQDSFQKTIDGMNNISTVHRAEQELAKHGVALPPEDDALELIDLIVAGKLERASGRFPAPRFPRRLP